MGVWRGPAEKRSGEYFNVHVVNGVTGANQAFAEKSFNEFLMEFVASLKNLFIESRGLINYSITSAKNIRLPREYLKISQIFPKFLK